MAVNLSPIWGAGAQLFDNSGNVLTGGKIYTYAAGTTTPATTYTSSSGITANSNPIILNSAGRVPYEIWLSDTVAYKFVLKDSNDTLIATYDNLVGINSNFIAYTAQQEIQTATAGQTVFNLATIQYQPATNNLSVFVDGVNQYGPGAQYAYVETDSDTVTFVSGLHVGASVKFTTASPVAGAVMNAENVAYDPPFTGAVGTNVEAKLAQTVSVKDFGAVGDGVVDDTAAFLNAIAYAKPLRRAVWIPEGTYNISSTLELTGDYYGASLIGESREGTKIISFVSGTTALIQMTGGSGTATNVHICDMTLLPNTLYEGVAIRIDGQDLAVIERLNIEKFKYGVWLHNDTTGVWTELNTFRDCWITNCDNCIRMEQGGGNDSFHGNTFDGVWGNPLSARSQIFFNHVSGYYYNGNFRLHVWTDGANSQVLNHDGNAELNTGSIQIESFNSPGFINGTGKWLYEGELLVAGDVNVNSGYLGGQPAFACENKISAPPPLVYASRNFLPPSTTIEALDTPVSRPNGLAPSIVKLTGAGDQQSAGAIIYNGNAYNNGFWVLDLGFQQNPEETRPLWKMGSDGSFGYSYSVGLARGTNYASWASRSPQGAQDGDYAYDDGSIRFSRADLDYGYDTFTHDAGFVIATNNSVRDNPPTDRIWVDRRGIYPAADNAYSCGASGYRFSVIYAATGTINTSDARQKDDIQDSVLGLNFINSLRPVSYKWKVGGRSVVTVPDGEEEYTELEPFKKENGEMSWREVTKTRQKFREEVTETPGKRTHWGLLAQEVKQAVDAAGVDFAGWVKNDLDNPDSEEGLRYDELIAPLIKAVQELSEEIALLKAKK